MSIGPLGGNHSTSLITTSGDRNWQCLPIYTNVSNAIIKIPVCWVKIFIEYLFDFFKVCKYSWYLCVLIFLYIIQYICFKPLIISSNSCWFLYSFERNAFQHTSFELILSLFCWLFYSTWWVEFTCIYWKFLPGLFLPSSLLFCNCCVQYTSFTEAGVEPLNYFLMCSISFLFHCIFPPSCTTFVILHDFPLFLSSKCSLSFVIQFLLIQRVWWGKLLLFHLALPSVIAV